MPYGRSGSGCAQGKSNRFRPRGACRVALTAKPGRPAKPRRRGAADRAARALRCGLQQELNIEILLEVTANQPCRQFVRGTARQQRREALRAKVEKFDADARGLVPATP